MISAHRNCKFSPCSLLQSSQVSQTIQSNRFIKIKHIKDKSQAPIVVGKLRFEDRCNYLRVKKKGQRGKT